MLGHLSMTVEETLDRLTELANVSMVEAMLERYGFGIQGNATLEIVAKLLYNTPPHGENHSNFHAPLDNCRM